MQIDDILVPVDFSQNSFRAIEYAIGLLAKGGEICLLHVVDADFIARLVEEEFAEPEAAIAKLREKAEARLSEVIGSLPDPKPEIDPMVVVGKPFAEILRVTVDLDFQMIVLGRQGRRLNDIEDVLFGSTAEKVLRAARVPVICVPPAWRPRVSAT
jgi:nucleotide-binding universal stress UspA family protein